MVAFEGHYAIQTGGLKRFSEQEFLDCTYEGKLIYKVREYYHLQLLENSSSSYQLKLS